MSVLFDRVARTYFVTSDSTAAISNASTATATNSAGHSRAPYPAKRQRMRAAAREVLRVLYRARPAKLGFFDLSDEFPGVHWNTMQVRLSQMTARGDICREGKKGEYLYSLPANSTFHSTEVVETYQEEA